MCFLKKHKRDRTITPKIENQPKGDKSKGETRSMFWSWKRKNQENYHEIQGCDLEVGIMHMTDTSKGHALV